MNVDVLKNDYILSKNMLNIFWNLMNSNDNENHILIKDLLDFNKIMINGLDNYTFNLYKKLIKDLLDIIYLDFTIINKIINNLELYSINELYNNIPTDIKEILNINNIEKIIRLYNNMDDYELDLILFDLEDYCDNLNDLLDMFFDTNNWYKKREKYLNCDDGKETYNIYLKYAKNNFLLTK